MPPMKKSVPPKSSTEEEEEYDFDFIFDDFMDESFSPAQNEPKTRQEANTVMEEVPNMSDTNQTAAKKKKLNESIEVCGELEQKTLIVINRQLDARKQVIEKMLNNLTDLIEDFEDNYNFFKELEPKLEDLIRSYMTWMHQFTTVYKEKLESFKELNANFKKRYEDIDLEQRGETQKLGEELEEDISKLAQKFIKETKRGEWEKIQKFFMEAMQNNF